MKDDEDFSRGQRKGYSKQGDWLCKGKTVKSHRWSREEQVWLWNFGERGSTGTEGTWTDNVGLRRGCPMSQVLGLRSSSEA